MLGLAAQAGLSVLDVPAHALPASLEELTQAAQAPGLVLAAHTWTHPNLAALHGAEFEEELLRPLTWLHQRFDRVMPWIAYPYGLTSPEGEAAVERAGYEAGFLVAGGWLPEGGWPRLRIPRLNIPAGLSEAGFIVRIAGLMGA
ncbi:MAG: polysaccharide deacetylase family protein [Gemmatimonadetes bacterium]|nr:polysaccharide deacetylase family protein [Gemmatimonadota bacterium]